MRSPWSVGLLMILFAGIGITSLGQPHPPLGAIQWIVCGALIVGGGLMFLKQPWTKWVAIAAAALLVVDGAIAFKRPELGLSIQPAISVVVGAYLMLRTLLVKPHGPRRNTFAPPPGESA